MGFNLDKYPSLTKAMESLYPSKTSLSQLNVEQFKKVLSKMNESNIELSQSMMWHDLFRYLPLSNPTFRNRNGRQITEEDIKKEVTTAFYNAEILSEITGETFRARKPAYNFTFLNKTHTYLMSPTLDCYGVQGRGNIIIGEVHVPSIKRLSKYMEIRSKRLTPLGASVSGYEQEEEIFSKINYDMVMAKARLGLVTDGEFYLFMEVHILSLKDGKHSSEFGQYMSEAVKDLNDDSKYSPMAILIALLTGIFQKDEMAYNRDSKKIYNAEFREDLKKRFLSSIFREEIVYRTFNNFWKPDGVELRHFVVPSAKSIEPLRLKQDYHSVILKIDGNVVDPKLANKKVVVKCFDLLFSSLSKTFEQKADLLNRIKTVHEEEVDNYNAIREFNAMNSEEHRIRSAYLDVNVKGNYFYYFTANTSTGDLGKYVTSGPTIFLKYLIFDEKCSKVDFDDALDQLSRVHSAALNHGSIKPGKIGVDGNGGTVFINYESATAFVFRGLMTNITKEDLKLLRSKAFEKDLNDLYECWKLKDPNKSYEEVKNAYNQLMEKHEDAETVPAKHGKVVMTV